MGWFEDIQKVLGYPASVLTGLAKSGSEHEVVDRKTGEVIRKYDPIKEGFKGELSPSRWRAMTNPETDKRTGGQQVGDTALDVIYDPMTWIGGLGLAGKGLKGLGVLDDASKATSKLGQIYEGTNLLGKVEGATNLNRGGQMARRAYQAMQLGGDGTAAMMAYPLISGTERAGTKLLAKALAKGGSKTVANQADPWFKEGRPELETAAMKRKMLELGPGPKISAATDTTDLFPDGRPMPGAEVKGLDRGPASGIGETPHPVGIREPEILPLNKGFGPAGELGPAPTPPIPMGGIPGQQNYDEVLAKLLGKKQDAALEGGQYPSTVLNDLLSSGRSGKGRFLNPEGRNVIEAFLANPSARDQVLRSRTTRGISPDLLPKTPRPPRPMAPEEILTKAVSKNGAEATEVLAEEAPEALTNVALKGVTPEDGGEAALEAIRRRLQEAAAEGNVDDVRIIAQQGRRQAARNKGKFNQARFAKDDFDFMPPDDEAWFIENFGRG